MAVACLVKISRSIDCSLRLSHFFGVNPVMKKETKIYIAGHRGLVGSATVRILQAKGYTNIITRTSKELDLRRQADVEVFFEKERPDYVF